MPFKLVVVQTPEGPSGTPNAYVFNQERVTIGRDASNDLHLSDFKRVVSKQHAEIVQAGGGFQLTDLGSKNFTYLNGERLQSGTPHAVAPGDTIQIGEYEIKMEAAEALPPSAPAFEPDLDRTVFDASFVNPFEEGASLLAAALRDLGKHYEQMTPQRRDDALHEAMQDLLDDRGKAALEAISRVVVGGEASTPSPAWSSPESPSPGWPSAEPPREPSSPGWPPAGSPPAGTPFSESPAPDWPPAWPSPGSPSPDGPPAEPTAPARAPSAIAPPSARVEQVLDTVLRLALRLIGAPWRFRHEFIGQTVMQAEDTAFLQGADRAQLKRHLLDPSVPEDQARQRLQRLEEAGEEVALHLVALLDGYKAGVQEGAKRLIDQLHPEAVVEEATKSSALYRLVPLLAKAAALDRMEEQLRELRQEDWSAAERRAYRPAFIKAYLARMTAPRLREEVEERAGS